MRGGGRRTRLMARAGLFMLTVTSMMGTGKTTRLMAMASTVTWMVLDMKGIGRRTSSMERGWRHGLMEPATGETMLRERSMGLGASLGPMEAPTRGNSLKIILKDQVSTSGLMGGSMMESGRTTRWKGMVSSHGLMEGNTRENI